jgi:hydroxymethylpyrimidine/phosphomethylpyrimidine kinase
MSMPRRPSRVHPAVAVTIAASDSSGGAGVQADLAVFAAHGVWGASVVTAVTAQSTRGISRTLVLPAEIVRGQIDAVFPDLAPAAVKIGALGDAAVVRAVAGGLRRHARSSSHRNVVLDPVLASKGGSPLLARGAERALLRDLFPLCDLVTPNRPEAEALAGIAIRDESDRRVAAGILADAGAGAVLVKGGHGPSRGGDVDDLFFDGRSFRNLRHPRVTGPALHGTGCVLSSAIVASLALGASLAEAVEAATRYLEEAMADAVFPGRGRGSPRARPASTPRTGTGRRASRTRRRRAP